MMREENNKLIFLTLILLVWKSQAADVVVKCNFSDSIYYISWSIPAVYQCEVTNPGDFIGDQVKIVGVEGTHLSGKSNDDVTAFYLKYAERLVKIPSNIENIFKNLILLRIENSNLSEVDGNDIKSLEHLKYFWIQYGKIKIIPSNLFRNHPNIKAIFLHHNKIEKIDRDAFNNLNELSQIHLYGNLCMSLNHAFNKADVLKIVEKIKKGDCQLSKSLTTTTENPTTTTEDPEDIELREKNQQIEECKRQQEQSLKKIAECETDKKQQFDNFTIENQKCLNETHQLTQQIADLNKKVEKYQRINELVKESIENVCKSSNNYQILIGKFVQSNERIEKCEARMDIIIEQGSTFSSVIKTLENQLKIQNILLEDKIEQHRKLEEEWDKLVNTIKEMS